ncbi:hypothetical protein U1Q18_010914 [Sarracenia purpurea var. burkii]
MHSIRKGRDFWGRRGKKTDPIDESNSSSSRIDGDEDDALVPQTSQLALRYGFRKVQALQDHLGAVGADEEGDEEGDGWEDNEEDDEEKQIWQVDLCEGALMKVHREQVQAIDLRGKCRVFLTLFRCRE